MHLFLQCFLQREMMLIFSETGKNDYHQICYHLRHSSISNEITKNQKLSIYF